MPILTDAKCKQKYSSANTLSELCAGETGQNKDTCQVFKFFLIQWKLLKPKVPLFLKQNQRYFS